MSADLLIRVSKQNEEDFKKKMEESLPVQIF